MVRDDGVFPRPAGLEPAVEFWRRVFGEWSLGEAVLHDDRHLALVYEVVRLPGVIGESYTDEQRARLQAAREQWRERLRALESALDAGVPLSPSQQALAAHIGAFAGPGAIIGAAERLRSQRGQRERFLEGLAESGRYLPAFRAIFQEAGLPEDLAYLPHVESSFRNHARSSAGAVGMWQFTAPAAQTFMTLNEAVDERLDPLASARGAARYLRHAIDRLEHWPMAVTSYNHGIGGMSRARRAMGDDFVRIVDQYDGPHFGFASRNFYAEFLAVRELARDPGIWFGEPVAYAPPLALDQVILGGPARVGELAAYYGVDPTVLRAYNPAWLAPAASGRTALPAGMRIWLPAGTLATMDGADGTALAMREEPPPTTP